MSTPDPEPTSRVLALPERWGRWLFDRPFLRVPDLLWERDGGEVLAVDEFVENGVIVVRAGLPGIDPDKDMEVDVADDTLRISAQRGAADDDDEFARREFLHRELPRRSVRRVLPMPAGTQAATVTATYRDGVLEIQAPLATERSGESAKVAIDRG